MEFMETDSKPTWKQLVILRDFFIDTKAFLDEKHTYYQQASDDNDISFQDFQMISQDLDDAADTCADIAGALNIYLDVNIEVVAKGRYQEMLDTAKGLANDWSFDTEYINCVMTPMITKNLELSDDEPDELDVPLTERYTESIWR